MNTEETPTFTEEPEEDWIPENEIASSAGVSLERVRQLRHDLPPEKIKKEGRRVWIARSALAGLVAGISGDAAVMTLEPKKNAATGLLSANPDCAVVKVVKIPMNPRIVLAEHEGRTVRVRVRDSKKYWPGLLVQCRWVDTDLLERIGNDPRWKGDRAAAAKVESGVRA